jgi:hypothetical protein
MSSQDGENDSLPPREEAEEFYSRYELGEVIGVYVRLCATGRGVQELSILWQEASSEFVGFLLQGHGGGPSLHACRDWGRVCGQDHRQDGGSRVKQAYTSRDWLPQQVGLPPQYQYVMFLERSSH